MRRFKGSGVVFTFGLLVAILILGQTVPAVAGPPNIALNSKIQLNQAEHAAALGASQALLQQHFAADIAQNLATRADTNIIRRTPNGYEAEMLVLGLEKATYTAKLSRVEYSVEGGQTKVKGIQKNFAPSFNENPPLVAANAQVQESKNKGNIVKFSGKAPEMNQFNHAAIHQQALQAEAAEPHHSWWAAKGLSNTSANEFPSAVTYAQQIYNLMYYRFGSAALRIGPQSTKGEITDFLGKDYNLLAWSNIGHGVTNAPNGSPCYGLVQKDATIWYSDFVGAAMAPYIGIYHAVALTNSCNSFKNPLNAYIWSRSPKTYVGGNILLPVGNSEKCSYHFWWYTLISRLPMATALAKAQADIGFPAGTFGIRGYVGVF
jgi:hypothetical protein